MAEPIGMGNVKVDDDDYNGYEGYDGDDFDTGLLEETYADSRDLEELGIEVIKEFKGYLSESFFGFKEQVAFLQEGAGALYSELLAEESVVEKQAQNALDRNLKQQASLAATMGGGSAGRAQSQLLAQIANQNQETSASSSALRLQEDFSRKELAIKSQQSQSQLINQALGGQASVAESGLKQGTSLAATGLQGQLSSASKIADVGLGKQKLLSDVHRTKVAADAAKHTATEKGKADKFSAVLGAIGSVAGIAAEYKSAKKVGASGTTKSNKKAVEQKIALDLLKDK